MKHLKFISALVLSVCIVMSGCKEEETVSDETAPSLPPPSSFIMDFEAFPLEKKENGRVQQEEYANWGYAILNVAAWQAGLALNLALPVAAFGESFNHDPVYVSDMQKWKWSYEVQHAGQTFEANLYAKLAASDVKWEMYISKTGGYQDFLWFEGTSRFDKTAGDWKVYMEPEGDRRMYLTIDWKNDGEKDKEIKYTSADSKSDLNGSYIRYGISSTEDFNSFYDIYMKKDDNLVEIDYHTEKKTGRVKSKMHFGAENWFCWNSNLVNTDCQ